MCHRITLAVVGFAAVGAMLSVYAAAPSDSANSANSKSPGNSYYLYTAALPVDDSGVVAVPSRFQWSVETSWRGVDAQGCDLPDPRIMLRLYDPDRNFTALTAQMDLATASKLHHELGEIINHKARDPRFQRRPQLYRPKEIPMKRIIGVDRSGVAIVEDTRGTSQPDSPAR